MVHMVVRLKSISFAMNSLVGDRWSKLFSYWTWIYSASEIVSWDGSNLTWQVSGCRVNTTTYWKIAIFNIDAWLSVEMQIVATYVFITKLMKWRQRGISWWLRRGIVSISCGVGLTAARESFVVTAARDKWRRRGNSVRVRTDGSVGLLLGGGGDGGVGSTWNHLTAAWDIKIGVDRDERLCFDCGVGKITWQRRGI